jgi:hypothetical protein
MNTVDEAAPAVVVSGVGNLFENFVVAGQRKRAFFLFNTPVTSWTIARIILSMSADWQYSVNTSGAMGTIVSIEQVNINWNPATLNWNNQPAPVGVARVESLLAQTNGAAKWVANQGYTAGTQGNIEIGTTPAGPVATPVYGLRVIVGLNLTNPANLVSFTATGVATQAGSFVVGK